MGLGRGDGGCPRGEEGLPPCSVFQDAAVAIPQNPVETIFTGSPKKCGFELHMDRCRPCTYM